MVEPCSVVEPLEVSNPDEDEVIGRVGESNETASDGPKMKENVTEDVEDENLNDVEVKG